MIPVLGFMPDADPTTPGVLTDCDGILPTEAGFKGAPSPVSVGLAALASACRGAAVTRDLSGNRKFYAGTSTKLYSAGSTTWSDVSRVGDYTLGADDRWSFIQFGNSTIAATPGDVLQRSTGSNFADISGAPEAKIVEAAKGFVIAFNTSTSSDQWHCSALYDETDWTPAVATQCTTGRLVGGGGPITAARRFGDDVIAYKSKAMFLGRYAGPPTVWDWTQIPAEIGCVGQDAVVDTYIGHVFVGDDDIYVFDGVRPQPLNTKFIRRWFNSNRNHTYNYRTQVQWDRVNNIVWIRYPSASSTGDVDACLAYHVTSQRWGVSNLTVESIVNYTSPTMTYDTGSSLVSTYDASPSISFDSPFWVAGISLPAVFDSTHTVMTLSGESEESWFETGDFGDEDGLRMCTGLKVRYMNKPDTATAQGYYRDEQDNAFLEGSTSTLADGKFDLRQTGRFHRFRVDMTGDHEFTAIRPALKATGAR